MANYLGSDLTFKTNQYDLIKDSVDFIFRPHPLDIPFNRKFGLERSMNVMSEDINSFLELDITNLLKQNNLDVKLVSLYRNNDKITINLSYNGELITEELT